MATTLLVTGAGADDVSRGRAGLVAGGLYAGASRRGERRARAPVSRAGFCTGVFERASRAPFALRR